jgi:hypothetical protein
VIPGEVIVRDSLWIGQKCNFESVDPTGNIRA